MNTILRAAALVAALWTLAACEPTPAHNGRPVAASTTAGEGRLLLPPYARPVTLRATVTGLAAKEGETPPPPVLRLFDPRRSEKLALEMHSEGTAVYGLRPGYYRVDRVAGYACGIIGFAVGERDGTVALGTWTLAVDPENQKKATLTVEPLAGEARLRVADRLSTPVSSVRSAVSEGPWSVECGLGADDRFGGRSAGEVAALSVLGLAGATAALATGNPTVLIIIGGV